MITFSYQIRDKLVKVHCIFHPLSYDHPHILAGQGTIGLEILEQVDDVDAMIVPVGGGGLIAGMAVAVKSLYPRCQIIVSSLFFCFSSTNSDVCV